MTLIVLAAILAALLIATGGKRGLKTAATLVVNMLVFFGMTRAMLAGLNPIFAAIIACILICVVSLFFNSGINAKSIASFASVVAVVLLIWVIVSVVGRGARIEGFAFKNRPEIMDYSGIININMSDLTVACIMVGLIGAIVDTSIAVSSAQFEVAYNNPHIGFAELYRSGIKVGRDVLGTTCNTLYFAFLGGNMALLILYALRDYGIKEIANSAPFAENFIRSMSSAFGCVLIMPITALFTAALLKTKMSRVVDSAEERKRRFRESLDREPYPNEHIDADFDDK